MTNARLSVVNKELDNVDDLSKQLLYLNQDFSILTKDYLQQLLEKITKVTIATYDNIVKLCSDPQNITYQTVVQPLINLDIITDKAKGLCFFSKQFHSTDEIRQESVKISDALEKLAIDCENRQDVYQVFQLYEKLRYSVEKSYLHPEQNRFFSRLMRNYKRNGLNITDNSIKNEIFDIQKQISQLCNQFEKNVADENTFFMMTKKELQGLPDSWFTSEREIEPGKFKVTLKYPDYFPILDYAENREVRKTIYVAFYTRCVKENLPILATIVNLRQRLAALLGYKTHGDYVTEIRMVKNSQAVRTFLDDMAKQFDPLLRKKIAELTEFAKQQENNEAFALENYDLYYYNRLLSEKNFNIDMKMVDRYFNLKKVLEGTFAIYEKLLGLQFIENKAEGKWHEKVRGFDVYNFNYQTNTMGDRIGSFYLDLYPREGKYPHMAAFDLAHGADISYITGDQNSPRQLSSAAIICNFPKEGGLSLEDYVVTFFHEFGHVMHSVCTKTKFTSFSAYKVETDFVEVPSQMLENWCYDHTILNMLSAHPESGEPLSEEMMIKLKEIKKATDSFMIPRQLVLGHFDYDLHTLLENELKLLDIKSLYQQIQMKIMHITPTPQECYPASFGHLVSGYDMGYYGYMMSYAYAVDMFTTKFKQKPLCPIAGAEYRKYILEPGATQDGMDLMVNFLGRPPMIDAFLEACGLQQQSALKKETSLETSSFFTRRLPGKDDTNSDAVQTKMLSNAMI